MHTSGISRILLPGDGGGGNNSGKKTKNISDKHTRQKNAFSHFRLLFHSEVL